MNNLGNTCYHDSTENTVWPYAYIQDESMLVNDIPHDLRINLFLYDGGIWKKRFRQDPNYKMPA